MQRILGFTSFFLVIALALFVWHKNREEATVVSPSVNTPVSTEKLSIVTTFYPLGEFAQNVAGEHAEIKVIVPTGAEPHDYEPSPQDILSVYEADIFLLNGAGIDGWAEKIRPELEQKGVSVIQMSEKVTLLPGEGKEIYDPHFWLDPLLVQEEVRAITTALVAKDSAREQYYREREKAYVAELKGLDQAYRTGLTKCSLKTVVTSHDAFSYLSQRYGFEIIAIAGISPEGEPSPRRLAELTGMIKEKGIRYVFFETLVSPKVAETLAKEAGIETLVFNPLEGLTNEEKERGENYLSIMKTNLDNLKTALACQK